MSNQAVLWFKFFIILDFTTFLKSSSRREYKQLYPIYKIPYKDLNPEEPDVRQNILSYHNFFRAEVQPTASNMLLMSWHADAAHLAQRYAERCIFLQHNDPQENAVPYLGTCGQNLFAAEKKIPWFLVVETWFSESRYFTFGDPRDKSHEYGHYTQMVWATSHKIGCGLAHCSGGPWGNFYNYLCHYCPAGNIATIIHYPYKPGVKCGDCKDQCVSDALCTNVCPKRDYYANCDEVIHLSPGYCRDGYCNATCSCGDKKIHKNYPW